ncbi:hypothetical protein [Acetobacter sp.]|jgi:hypothetical protein|nr:hypothetical protein [Acetobacter sp.]
MIEDIKALLQPIREDRAPTEAEWDFARQQLDDGNAAVQAG